MRDDIARHLTVSGQVQGVGFRAFVRRTAGALALRGWVRNRRDGSVEVLAVGQADSMEALIAACRKGPAGARVNDLAVRDEDPAAAALQCGPGFEQRQTV